LGDNDLEYLPPEIGQLKNLQIVCLAALIHICLFNNQKNFGFFHLAQLERQ